jgi:hypothetical protein
LLKFLREDENGNFTFTPDPVEKYLALRHSNVQSTPEDSTMEEEEKTFLHELTIQ